MLNSVRPMKYVQNQLVRVVNSTAAAWDIRGWHIMQHYWIACIGTYSSKSWDARSGYSYIVEHTIYDIRRDLNVLLSSSLTVHAVNKQKSKK